MHTRLHEPSCTRAHTNLFAHTPTRTFLHLNNYEERAQAEYELSNVGGAYESSYNASANQFEKGALINPNFSNTNKYGPFYTKLYELSCTRACTNLLALAPIRTFLRTRPHEPSCTSTTTRSAHRRNTNFQMLAAHTSLLTMLVRTN